MSKPRRPMIATAASDAALEKKYRALGLQAKIQGLAREACPHHPNSLVASWWFAGYDSLTTGE